MGFPFFTWWPHQSKLGTTRQTITLSEGLSDLQITPKRDIIDTYTIDGGRVRELLRPYLDVRIVLERYTDRNLFRDLNSMINHLERGGTVAFGLDSENAWSCQLLVEVEPGATLLKVGPNETSTYHADSASAVPQIKDEITIESGPPVAKRESHVIEGIGTSGENFNLTIDPADVLRERATFDYFPEGSTVRFSDFFPTMILPTGAVGSMMNTHDHRIAYTLDITLTYVIPRKEIAVPNQYGNLGIATVDQPQYDIKNPMKFQV